MPKHIRIEADKTIRALREVAGKQWPFTMTVALNELAYTSQRSVQRVTKRNFNLHSNWIPRNVWVRRAKKRSFTSKGVISSAVFTAPRISGYMPIHEYSGTRTPIATGNKDKGRAFTIPTGTLKDKGFKTKRGRVKKRWQPKTLLKNYNAGAKPSQSTTKRAKRSRRRDPFVIKSRKSGQLMIVRRQGYKSRPLEVLYIFSKQARYQSTWQFEPTVRRTVQRAYRQAFNRAYKVAMSSAR